MTATLRNGLLCKPATGRPIHAGALVQHIPLITQGITGIVRRGGSILAEWMAKNHMLSNASKTFARCGLLIRYRHSPRIRPKYRVPPPTWASATGRGMASC